MLNDTKKLLPIAVILISLAVLLGSTSFALGAPPKPQEVPGLKEMPDKPVRSIPLRRKFPDHPHGPPTDKDKKEPGGGGCDKDVDLTGTINGVVAVAAQDNVICTNADVDTYVRDGRTYVVQAGGEEAAWTHTDVTDPGNPVVLGQFVWSGGAGKNTYTPDVKYFAQGTNDYIALSLERLTVNAFCGVVIMNITDPANPVLESQATGGDWCDVHNTFVEDDANGDGQYIYLTADGPNDMRVLEVSGGGSVTNPVEIGRYIAPTANNDNYVHDITVLDHGGSVGRRAYLAYWDSGLVILNAADVTPGTNPTPIVGPNVIDPAGFLSHHAWASQDGSLVFNQDEFLNANGDEPVQMWNVSDPANPSYVDGLALGTDVPVNAAHNLEIRFDINPNRLYVAWYKLGLQAWDFTSGGFAGSRALYHQAQTEGDDDEYSGAWGVRMENIGTNLYIFQSDRNFGLIVDCVGCSAPTPTPTPEPGGTMHVGDLDGSSSSGRGNKWNATVTITVHDGSEATLSDATVSGSWSAGGSASCTTDGNGQCTVTKNNINGNNNPSATFNVTNVTHTTNTYESGDNHDPDGDSDGTSITINKP